MGPKLFRVGIKKMKKPFALPPKLFQIYHQTQASSSSDEESSGAVKWLLPHEIEHRAVRARA
jgi:hypothetical protein